MKTFRLRYALISLILISLAIVAITTIMFSEARKIAENEIATTAIAISTSVAINIMENLDEYEDFLDTFDISGMYYRKMQNNFNKIKNQTPSLNFLYTLKKVSDDKVIYILDAESIGSLNWSAPGVIDGYMEEYLNIFNSSLPTYTLVRESNRRIIVTGYSGIYDSSGDLIGIVGADLDGSHIFTLLSSMVITIIISFVLLLTIVGFLIKKILPYLLEPMLKDKLTGAYNKKYFEETIKVEIQKKLKYPNNIAVMMLDLDHFKKINDTYGHLFGDKVLSSTAELINNTIRKNDYFIRYGGEEFMVILTRNLPRNTELISERIRDAIEKNLIFNDDVNKTINVTISIGVSIASEIDISVDELIKNADKALYEAKEKRNNVVVYKND